ncbi:DUF3179 domain-containing protein [bacterium]|nr:DUF3179 domain-containing protein [bacterium]
MMSTGSITGVMAKIDRETSTAWDHYAGNALNGPLAESDASLEILPVFHLPWSEWRALYPQTTVLPWDDAYVADYADATSPIGERDYPQGFTLSIVNRDNRLQENEIVLGIISGENHVAYPMDSFPSGLSVYNDQVDDTPVVIFAHPEQIVAVAFSATLDGEQLTFTMNEGAIQDRSGSTWSLTGYALDGPYAGRQLEHIPSFVSEWYGWSSHFTDTELRS